MTRVLSFTLDIDENQLINAANLDGRITTFDTSPKTGVGQGLTLTFEVSQSAWDATNMHTSNEPLDGLFSFKFDKYGFLWVWEYDPVVETWKQKSRFFGPDIVENSYDTSEINKRETSDAMLYNLISRHRLGYKQNVFEYMEDSVIETTVGLDTITTFDRPDYPSTYYVLDNYPAEYHIYDKYRLTYYTDAKVTDTKSQLIFPRYNEINLWKYGNKGVSLEYMNTDSTILSRTLLQHMRESHQLLTTLPRKARRYLMSSILTSLHHLDS